MDDLATLTARPRPLVLGGVTYQVHPLTLADLGDLERWVQDQYPDPLGYVQARMDGLPLAVQKHMITSAIDAAARPRPKLGTPEADALVNSVGGVQEVLYLSIAKGDPSFTRAKAAAVFGSLLPGDLVRLFSATHVDMVVSSDPKVQAGTPDGSPA